MEYVIQFSQISIYFEIKARLIVRGENKNKALNTHLNDEIIDKKDFLKKEGNYHLNIQHISTELYFDVLL